MALCLQHCIGLRCTTNTGIMHLNVTSLGCGRGHGHLTIDSYLKPSKEHPMLQGAQMSSQSRSAWRTPTTYKVNRGITRKIFISLAVTAWHLSKGMTPNQGTKLKCTCKHMRLLTKPPIRLFPTLSLDYIRLERSSQHATGMLIRSNEKQWLANQYHMSAPCVSLVHLRTTPVFSVTLYTQLCHSCQTTL